MARQQIPWLRIGTEGTAIVVSILLAFAIDAAWERRGADLIERYLTDEAGQMSRLELEEMYAMAVLTNVLDQGGPLDALLRLGADFIVPRRAPRPCEHWSRGLSSYRAKKARHMAGLFLVPTGATPT